MATEELKAVCRRAWLCLGCEVEYNGTDHGPAVVEVRGDKNEITSTWRCRQCGRETITTRPYPAE